MQAPNSTYVVYNVGLMILFFHFKAVSYTTQTRVTLVRGKNAKLTFFLGERHG